MVALLLKVIIMAYGLLHRHLRTIHISVFYSSRPFLLLLLIIPGEAPRSLEFTGLPTIGHIGPCDNIANSRLSSRMFCLLHDSHCQGLFTGACLLPWVATHTCLQVSVCALGYWHLD